MSRFAFVVIVTVLVSACSHPLEIVGEGDIVDANGSSHGCTLEQYQSASQACVNNYVIAAYDVNYQAIPRTGWIFDHWEGACAPASVPPHCKLQADAAAVQAFWGQVMPATRAVFVEQQITDVELDTETIVMPRRGMHQALVVTVLDQQDNPVTDASVVWESDNPAVATVSEHGLVTGRAKGSALISATVAGQSAFVDVTVKSLVPNEGLIYTVWFARNMRGAAVLVGDEIRYANVFGDVVQDLAKDNGDEEHFFPNLQPDSPELAWRRGVSKFQWAGNRIAILSDVLDGVGTLRVIDRHEEWRLLGLANTRDFQLEGNFIGQLLNTNVLRIKTGLDGAWTTASGSVKSFKLHGQRIAVHTVGEGLRVKDDINAAWTILYSSGVADYQLDGDRIAVLETGGRLRVKDGINGGWKIMAADNIKQFLIKDGRIGLLLHDGAMFVKDGLDDSWTALANSGSGVEKLLLDDNRIGQVYDSGLFRVKDGINGGWTVLADSGSGFRDFQFQDDYIGRVSAQGALSVKKGINGAWGSSESYGDELGQMQLAVALPMEPYRTTLASYSANHTTCLTQGSQCYDALNFALPASWYGRFCGGGHPADWGWAIGQGPIDGLDAMCLHHDRTAWYPIYNQPGVNLNKNTCIVYYAIDHAKLTNNNTLIQRGTAAWTAQWNRMPRLRDALFNPISIGFPLGGYELATYNTCYDYADFINETANPYYWVQ